MIRIQEQDFDIGAEIARIKDGRTDIGAIVCFIGTVRDQMGAVEEMTGHWLGSRMASRRPPRLTDARSGLWITRVRVGEVCPTRRTERP